MRAQTIRWQIGETKCVSRLELFDYTGAGVIIHEANEDTWNMASHRLRDKQKRKHI
jgi:hypothetical protein